MANMISKSKSFKTDGNNTVRRFSSSEQRQFNRSRVVLSGFPIEKKFSNVKDIDMYFSGDRIQCLLCGKSYKSLGTHLSVHGISVDEYKEKYGLPWGKGLVCESTSNLQRIRSEGRLNRGLSDDEMSELIKTRSSSRGYCHAYKKELKERAIEWQKKNLERLRKERDLISKKVIKMVETGLQYKDICKRLNISYPKVKRIISEA